MYVSTQKVTLVEMPAVTQMAMLTVTLVNAQMAMQVTTQTATQVKKIPLRHENSNNEKYGTIFAKRIDRVGNIVFYLKYMMGKSLKIRG